MQGEDPTQFERQLARNIKGNKKELYRYVKSKRKTRDSINPVWTVESNLIIDDAEKAELLNALFTLFFTNRGIYQMMSAVGSRDREGNKQPRVMEGQVRGYLEMIDAFKLAAKSIKGID